MSLPDISIVPASGTRRILTRQAISPSPVFRLPAFKEHAVGKESGERGFLLLIWLLIWLLKLPFVFS